MLPTNLIESVFIIVETPPSKSEKSTQEPFIRVLTPVELMDSSHLNSPTQNSPSADPGAEPGVEIIKGAASLSPQQLLPTVHNLVPATTPAFSSYRSMFQGWKNSVPKLYKYPSSEIEVVVYRKNGEIGKITNGEGVSARKKISLKENSPAKSEESSTEDESCKNVSHLMKNIAKPLVITPDPALETSVSLLPEQCKYEEDIMSSPSPSSLPHFPLQFSQQQVSDSAKKIFTITRVTQEPFSGTQNTTIYRPYVPNVLSVCDATPDPCSSATPQEFGQVSAFMKPNMTQGTKNEKHCKENCHFMFGFGLAPLKQKEGETFVDNLINIETLLKDDGVTKISDRRIAESQKVYYLRGDEVQKSSVETNTPLTNYIDQCVQNTPTVTYASAQTVLLTTKGMAVQTDPEYKKIVMEFGCQMLPNVSYQESQTDMEPQKAVMEFGCQNVPITSYHEIQTEPEPNKSMAEFGCQTAPTVSYQECQTEGKALKNARCQTAYNQQSEETQTILEVDNAECQVSPISESQSNQTEQDILNPVANRECQAVVEMHSKLTQAEIETMEVASQCKPTGKNKAVQLSGACCYITEKRISNQYEKTMKEILEKAQMTLLEKDTASITEKSKGIPDQLKEDFTAEEIDRLVDRFNLNLMEAERNREELRVHVTELAHQVTFSRNSLNTTQTTDYFEDDILESSKRA